MRIMAFGPHPDDICRVLQKAQIFPGCDKTGRTFAIASLIIVLNI